MVRSTGSEVDGRLVGYGDAALERDERIGVASELHFDTMGDQGIAHSFGHLQGAYLYGGRNLRLTDVHGYVMREVIA